jgi:hypothetical protein
MPLDASIGRVFTPYRPGGRHGHQFRRKKSSCGIVKSLFEASVQKARKGPSTQLIEATSCVEMWNATIKAEELHNFSSYQTLITDTNWGIGEVTKLQQSSLKSWRSRAPMAVKLCTALTSFFGDW